MTPSAILEGGEKWVEEEMWLYTWRIEFVFDISIEGFMIQKFFVSSTTDYVLQFKFRSNLTLEKKLLLGYIIRNIQYDFMTPIVPVCVINLQYVRADYKICESLDSKISQIL